MFHIKAKEFLLIIVLFLPYELKALATSDNNVAFIGFNGGGDEFSNTGDYEIDLNRFKDFFDKNSIILNANGPKSKFIPKDQNGLTERNKYGQIILKETSLKNTKKANWENLISSAKNVSNSKPTAVTLLFTDHGSENGVFGWNEHIPNDTLQKIDDEFPPAIPVRRIHLHCFSGAALKKTSPIFSSEINTRDKILLNYPINRCGVSISKEDENAYDINTYTGLGGTPLQILSLVRPAPTLAQIKFIFNQQKNYYASPQLTSDYFKEEISKSLCQKKLQTNCNPENENLNSIRAISNNEMENFCKMFKDKENINIDFNKRLESISYSLNLLNKIELDAIGDFLRKNEPEKFRAWVKVQNLNDNLILCGNSKTEACKKIQSEWEQNKDNPLAKEFVVEQLTLSSFDQFSNKNNMQSNKAPVKYNINFIHFVDSYFKKELSSYFTSYPCKKYECEKDLSLKPNSTFGEIYSNTENKLTLLQKNRKAKIRESQKKIDTFLNSYLAQPENKELFDRMKNIEHCESIPINK